MSTVTLNDAQKTISLNVPSGMLSDNLTIEQLTTALDAVNVVMPISSVSLSGLSYTLTLKDSRSYQVTVAAGTPSNAPGIAALPPTSQIVSSSYWAASEINVLLAAAINQLLLNGGMTAMTVTYA
jgi:hypothetical protein